MTDEIKKPTGLAAGSVQEAGMRAPLHEVSIPRTPTPNNLAASKNVTNKSGMKIAFTVFTSSNPTVITKQYSLDDQGKLQKQPIKPLVEGIARTTLVYSMQGLAVVLGNLKANQALSLGTADQDTSKILSTAEYERRGSPSDVITRTRGNFTFRVDENGLLVLDCDMPPGGQAYSREELLAILTEIAPEFEAAAMVWFPSASSYINNGDEQLNGLRGHHSFVGVVDASDIVRAGEVLFDLSWLAGYGRIDISEAGTLLVRSVFDKSVWKPEGLVFAGGANCTPPVRQARGSPVVREGPLLDTRKVLLDLTPEQRKEVSRLQASAKLEKEPERQRVRAAYIERRALEQAGPDADEATLEKARATQRRALEHNVLTGDYFIYLADGRKVYVAEVLDNKSKYHGALTLDPLEPEYGGRRVVGKLYLYGGTATLHSFAHGGRTFKLIRQPSKVVLVQGRNSDAVDNTLDILKTLSDCFCYGDKFAIIRDGRVLVPNEFELAYFIGGVIQFVVVKQVKGELAEVNVDPPVKLVRTILTMPGGLKPLDAVITAPVVLPSGRWLAESGYDAESKLYLACNDIVSVPETPTMEQVKAALVELWFPVKDFPFATELDKAVMLAGMLTAINRAALPTSPGFGFDAPMPGSGKTKLAEILGALHTGTAPAISPPGDTRDDAEMKKRLLSILVSSLSVFVLDNVIGTFNSGSLGSFLTGSTYGDRILGQTRQCSLPNRLLLVITGNNLTFGMDLIRRILPCRIDPKTERPYARQFSINPVDYVERNRQRLVAAGLTLIRAWFCSHDFALGFTAKGRFASFEQWDDVVRQTVCWIDREVAPGEFGDVLDTIDFANQNDTGRCELLGFLQALHAAFGNKKVTAKNIVDKCTADLSSDGDVSPAGDALREALAELIGNHNLDTRSLGQALRNQKDRPVNGLVLRTLPNDSHGNKWYVETPADSGRPKLAVVSNEVKAV